MLGMRWRQRGFLMLRNDVGALSGWLTNYSHGIIILRPLGSWSAAPVEDTSNPSIPAQPPISAQPHQRVNVIPKHEESRWYSSTSHPSPPNPIKSPRHSRPKGHPICEEESRRYGSPRETGIPPSSE